MGCGKNGKPITYDGVTYASFRCLCRVLEVNDSTVYTTKKNKGFETLQDALDYVLKKAKDHEVRCFRTYSEMCKFHGVSYATYLKRIERGLSLKDALFPGKYATAENKKFNPLIKNKQGNKQN